MKLLRVLLLFLTAMLISSQSFAEDVVRIGILRFESKADGISQRNAESITDELTRMLASSYSIAIIDRSNLDAIAREQRMTLAGLIDPQTAVKIGHLAGIQYLITGAVTHFSATRETQVNDSSALWGLILKKDPKTAQMLSSRTTEITDNVEVTLDMRIIDVNTREVVLSMAETGKSTRTTTTREGGDNSSQSNVVAVDLRDAAISNAVALIGQRIKEAVVGEYPQVLRAGGKDIIISLGANAGARVGNLYKVSLEGEDIIDMRGKVIGRTTSPIAIVRVNEVKNNYSIVSVIKKGGNPSNIQRGDRVEISSSEEAAALIRRKAFLDKRPRKKLGMSTLEGEELERRLHDIDMNENRNASHTSMPESATAPVYEDKAVTAGSSSNSYSGLGSPSITSKLENHSDKAAKVIATYEISDSEKSSLIEQHTRTERMLSRDDKFDRYIEIFRSCPSDYLAAYQAAKISLEIGKNARAKEWAEKALAVNPRYGPAKRVLQAAINRLK